MMQFDKFLSHILFINVTIRECNFAMGTILGKGFAQDCPHGEIRHTLHLVLCGHLTYIRDQTTFFGSAL